MIPWFQFTVFHIGPIPIQVWGFFVALGVAVTLWILHARAKKSSLDPKPIVDLAFNMIIAGFIGARIFHVLFYEPSFFLDQPIEILKIWHGGMSSYGGFVGAAIVFIFKYKKIFPQKGDWRLVADELAYASLFGWLIGRVGCFMIHDHLGAHSTCPLALQTPDGPRLEMALLEIIGLIPLAIGFFLTRNKEFSPGLRLALLAFYYGVLRFGLDFYRATDIPGADTRYLGLTPAQYFSIVMAAWGGFWLAKQYLKKPVKK